MFVFAISCPAVSKWSSQTIHNVHQRLAANVKSQSSSEIKTWKPQQEILALNNSPLYTCEAYLNDVKDNILVEAVQDALGHTVVVPGSVDEQQILQVFKLCGRKVRGGKRQDE